MKKILAIISIFTLPVINLLATPINIDTAEKVAVSFLTNLSNLPINEKSITLTPYSDDQFKIAENSALYIFNINSSGFIIISGDDAAAPVLGYSFSNNFGEYSFPVQFTAMLNSFIQQIEAIRMNGISATQETNLMWQDLLQRNNVENKSGSVGPLINCYWNQDSPYNALCPEDPAGPGGKVYAGCVATMMAMTMYYYRFPTQGSGSHGYYSDYGYLESDFNQSVYVYEQMPIQISNYESPVAKLLYDCGVAVDMNYSPNGSGAYMNDALNAMKQYFSYNSTATLKYKDNYSETNWKNLLKSQLDAGMPLPYAGYDNSGGHAFVCDGYDGDMFHFNWGWSGYYNGYFYINNLNPNYNFSSGQQAFIDCYPETSSYTQQCQNYVLSGKSGSISTGNSYKHYSNNQSCSWFINPIDSVSQINIDFTRFKTESSNDVLSIYSGSDANGLLIGQYSGNTYPTHLIIDSNKTFITFTSNSSISDEGFHINYECNTPQLCPFISMHTDSAGTITDGSRNYSYNNNSNCKWKIEPENMAAVQFDFIEFDLEDNTDFLYVYDNQGYGSLVFSLTGSVIPQSFYINSSKILMIFRSNSSITDAGFKFNYRGLATGIEEENPLSLYIYSENDGEFLQMDVASAGNYNIAISDISGRIISSELYKVSASQNTIDLKTSRLCSGIYFCTISNPSFKQTLKFYR